MAQLSTTIFTGHSQTASSRRTYYGGYKARCTCGWEGKDTKNTRKSWAGHFFRATGNRAGPR